MITFHCLSYITNNDRKAVGHTGSSYVGSIKIQGSGSSQLGAQVPANGTKPKAIAY